MIKINLAAGQATIGAGPDAVPGGEGEKILLQSGGLKLFLMLLGPLAIWMFQNFYLIPVKTTEFLSKNTVLENLKQKNELAKTSVTEYKDIDDKKTRLQAQIDSIEALRKERMREVRILDFIQRQIPEKTWLRSVQVQVDKIIVSGQSISKNDIAVFMESVAKSQLTGDIGLISSKEKNMEGTLVNEFSFSAALLKPKPSKASSPGDVKR